MQKLILAIFFLSGTFLAIGQDTNSSSNKEEPVIKENKLRFDNAVVGSLGGSAVNGDLPGAQIDLNMQIGYKRLLGSNLNLSFTYNKFNIVFKDIYNEGFMSFDLDLEYMFFPEKEFTPYVYAGPGFHASNGFVTSEVKFQFGIGMEVMVSDGVGLKLYGDRNFLGNDTLDGLEAGAGNDAYYKLGFGANFYFPRNGKKAKDKGPSFINKNKLDDF